MSTMTGKRGVLKQRMTAEMEGPFVVFLIGMRINRPWLIHQWLPVFFAMPRMLAELAREPERGLLGYHVHLGFPNALVVQYWRSFEELTTYAGDRRAEHWPAWIAFNRRIGSNGAVGIWHETYRIAADGYECIYNNMPPYGLGCAGTLQPAVGRRSTAAGRIGRGQPS
jgi:hypothetical protein